jgi:DNA-binding XRE family transcriptional regulator
MPAQRRAAIDYRTVELDGVRYVIVRESEFEWLCRTAGLRREPPIGEDETDATGIDLDRSSLAEKLARRRRACGLSQADLARRAGIRPETLNRIERGRTTPDFATVRKLVVAMNQSEQENRSDKTKPSSPTESDHATES